MARRLLERESTNAVLAETVLPLGDRNFVTGRFEWSQRDELLSNDHELEEQFEQQTGSHTFDVAAVTAGYTGDLKVSGNVQVGVGVNVTGYWIEEALTSIYGDHPWGTTLFLRFRLRDLP